MECLELRNYIREQLQVPNLPFEVSTDNLVGDWCFIIILLGNDFIPGVIQQNGISNAIRVWKVALPEMGGPIFHSENGIDYERAGMFFNLLFPEVQVRVGEFYYQSKFGIARENLEARATVVREYFAGLAWILKSYSTGHPSWTWFYAYTKAPLKSDLGTIQAENTDFVLGVPLLPLEYLAATIHPRYLHLLPEPIMRWGINPDCPALDYFTSEENAATGNISHCIGTITYFSYLGTKYRALMNLPRMIQGIKSSEDKLTDKEKARNTRGEEIVLSYKKLIPVFPGKVENSYTRKRSRSPSPPLEFPLPKKMYNPLQ